ncbi:MAG: hypothetical protein KAI24_05010, partial [Planctomycetes bacterium]|nr:hypothetical protein [Planctomycetota bacterium]
MRWVFALIVLAVLGFTVSWLLDPGTQAPPPIPGAAATGGDGAPADPASAAVASQGPDAAGAAADAPVREDGAPTGDAFGPTVHVQHADGAPAVEATVWFLDERDARRERGREATWTYWDTTEEQGRRTRTDARGDVTLPLARGRWLVAAHKDGEFGYLAVGRDGRHVLHLQTDEQVTIAATFPDGSPAAIPVAVRHQHRPGNADTIWRGQTDADGRAVVRHFQLLRRAVAAGQPETFAERFAAMACVPTSPVVVTEFAGRPTDERPVQLQVPALGRLQIRLQCHSGVPLLSSARVGFGAERRNRAPDAFPISRGLLHQSTEKPVGDEPTSLPFAPVGQPLRVYARFPSDRRAAYSEQSPGPSEGGGTAEITIRPLPQHTVLAGRLLVGRDRALAGARMAVTIWRDDQVHTTTNIGTIADGRWDAVLSGREDEARWRIEFRHDARNERGGPSGDEAPERWLGAIVDLPPWPPGTRVELGDVLLEPLPPLCAGVVVDDRGQPIAGATISIEQHRENAARETVIEGLNASNLRQLLNERSNGRRPRDGWRRLNGLRTSTDERGHFLLEARMPPGRLRVRADSDKHFAEYVELPEPNQNLQIALARNGVLSGRLLL